MKCIKAVKQTKEVELGEIRRVDDKTAFNMVGSYWMYVSKSEWKKSIGRQVGTESELSRNQVGTKSELSQDQVKKKKNTKQVLTDNNGEEVVKTKKKSK
jgi:hypothetical protein